MDKKNLIIKLFKSLRGEKTKTISHYFERSDGKSLGYKKRNIKCKNNFGNGYLTQPSNNQILASYLFFNYCKDDSYGNYSNYNETKPILFFVFLGFILIF